MASELVSQGANDVMLYVVLVGDLLLMMTLVGTRSKMKRWKSVALGLIATGVAVLVTLGAFSEYSLDPAHVLSHTMFSVVILLCGRLLVTQEVPGALDRLILLELKTFDRFQYTLARTMMSSFERIRGSVELSVFDRFQYVLAQTIASLAGSAKKIHTGNLNLNMVFFLVGVIFCVLLLLSFMCF